MSPLITSRLHSTNYSWFMEEKNRAQKAPIELYHGYKIDVGESRDLSQGLLFQNPFLILHLKSPCVHMYVFVHVCLPHCAVHTCMGGHRHVSPTAHVWRSADNVTGLRQTLCLSVCLVPLTTACIDELPRVLMFPLPLLLILETLGVATCAHMPSLHGF